MSLEQKINEGIKAAMLAKDKLRLESLRAVKAAILLAKTSENAKDFDETAEIKMLQKLVKQRRETAEIYISNNRQELADKELAEATIIEEYLPKQLNPQEIEAAVKSIIEETGANSVKDMGKVMGIASKQLAGKADGKLIAELVKKLLQ
ncbi:MAG: GatB/YqeY domain-containing protein [Prevotellaceae bacterium]|jgi:uncharacterized protein YqeY|nr:GatB/YqeY domain-containing protein [Prevotellaceae bacterium]